MNDHITKSQFLLEFFGNFGRELGLGQEYSDNPMRIFSFIEECTKSKSPAFISVQPRRSHDKVLGFEKIFFDFDYGFKNSNYTESQTIKHKKKLDFEVRLFIKLLIMVAKVEPLIVKTRKGYHVYIYFDSVYEINYSDKNEEEFWKEVYGKLYDMFANMRRYKQFQYIDKSSRTDIKRLCRIPTSIHQKSGEECILVDKNLKPTKFRSIEYYKSYGLNQNHFKMAFDLALQSIESKKQELIKREKLGKDKWEVEHGFTGKIRPCFQSRMDKGEMSHHQRLALEYEAFYAGYNTEEKMIDFFKCFNDWDGNSTGKSNCRIQVKWFFKHKVSMGVKKLHVDRKPYRCDTLESKGWCLFDKCPIWRKRQEKLKSMKKLK